MAKVLTIALSVLCCVLVFGCATNPITGEEELMFYGEEQDVQIGRQYAPEIEKQLGGRVDDAELQAYVNSIGQKMAAVSQRPYFDYSYVVLDNDMLNAFALPGGQIYITSGMLKNMESEAELAGILAHETAHVVARDTTNAMSKSIGLGVLITAATSGEGAENARLLANYASQIIQLKYSRSDEKTADLAGLDYMVKTGYDPRGMVSAMEMLEAKSGSGGIEFLSTHPSPDNRVEYLKRRIQSRYGTTSGLKQGVDEYQRNVLGRLD